MVVLITLSPLKFLTFEITFLLVVVIIGLASIHILSTFTTALSEEFNKINLQQASILNDIIEHQRNILTSLSNQLNELHAHTNDNFKNTSLLYSSQNDIQHLLINDLSTLILNTQQSSSTELTKLLEISENIFQLAVTSEEYNKHELSHTISKISQNYNLLYEQSQEANEANSLNYKQLSASMNQIEELLRSRFNTFNSTLEQHKTHSSDIFQAIRQTKAFLNNAIMKELTLIKNNSNREIEFKKNINTLADSIHEQTNEIHNKLTPILYSKPPIIIGGCGRSGTTLLLSILSAHPEINTIKKETATLSPKAWDTEPDYMAPFKLKKLNLEILKSHQMTHNRWMEKTPKNIHFFERILSTFPEAKLIHMIRDGRDVILSMHPKQPDDYWVSPERWISDVSAGLNYLQHPNVFTLKYENLINHFDHTIKELSVFLDLELNLYLKEWQIFATKREDISWSHGIQSLHNKSIGRYKDHPDQSRITNFLSNPHAQNLLRQYGYIQ